MEKFGIGVGSLIFLANVVLLSMYTFSFVTPGGTWSGGCMNCFSCSAGAKTRQGVWERITHLEREPRPGGPGSSLFSVVITDLYVRGLRSGQKSHIHLLF